MYWWIKIAAGALTNAQRKIKGNRVTNIKIISLYIGRSYNPFATLLVRWRSWKKETRNSEYVSISGHAIKL